MAGIIDTLDLDDEETTGSIIDSLDLDDAEPAGIIDSLDLDDAPEIEQPKGWTAMDTAKSVGRAVLSPFNILTGIGDTPIAETEKDNRSRAAMAGIEYGGGDYAGSALDPLTAEKIIGGGSRIVATGGLGLAPLGMAGVEATVKAADIAQNEADAELSLANAGRVGLAGAATYLPIKGGAMAEQMIARTGLGRLGGFLGNAAADAGIGTAASVGQRVGEEALTGQEVTAGDFLPTTMDVVTGAPSAIAAGVGGATANAARRAAQQAEWDSTWGQEIDPVAVRNHERRLEAEQMVFRKQAHRDLVEGLDRDYEQTIANEFDTQKARIDAIRNIDDGRAPAGVKQPEPVVEPVAAQPKRWFEKHAPVVSELPDLPVGPTRITPKPIAEGKPLYRETNPEGLDTLIWEDGDYTYTNAFVTDNPDLAIGQGMNKGVHVVFRPDSVSGKVHNKPGTSELTGFEYAADALAPRAVQQITMPKSNIKSLKVITRRRLKEEFDRTELPDGTVQFTRKPFVEEEVADAAPVTQAEPTPQPYVSESQLALPAPEGAYTAGIGLGKLVRSRPTSTQARMDNARVRRDEQALAMGYVPKTEQEFKALGLSPLVGRTQDLAAQPNTAREAVVNSRGEQVAMPGRPAAASFGLSKLRTSPEMGNAEANPMYAGMVQGDIQPTAPARSSDGSPEFPDRIAQMEARGQAARNEEGLLPRRIEGVNLRTMAGNDTAKENFIAGAMMTSDEAIVARQKLKEGVVERALEIDKWKDIERVKKIQTNEVLADDESLALGNYTVGALAKAKRNPTEKNINEAIEYLSAYGTTASAAGRTLGSHNIIRKAWEQTLEPFERAMMNTAKMFRDVDKPLSADMMKPLLNVKDKGDDSQIMDALMEIKRKHQGAVGQISSYRFINMLSSPATQLGNIEANATTLADMVAGRPAAKLLDKLSPGERVYAPGETRAGLIGGREGVKDAVTKGLFVLRKGYRMGELDKLDPKSLPTELKGSGKNPLNYVSRALFAADEAFKGIADSFQRNSLAYRKAYAEAEKSGLTGDALKKHIAENLENYMWHDADIDKQAKEFAKLMVHQEPTMIESMGPGKSMSPGAKRVVKEGISVFQPFFNTIMNAGKKQIIAAGAGYAAPIYGMRRIGNMTREQKIRDVASAVNGTMAAVALYTFATNSDIEITTDVPKDEKERAIFYGTNKKPYHIYFGDYGSIDYRYLGPYAMVIMGVGKVVDAEKRRETDPNVSVPTAAIAGVGQALAGLPVLSNVGTLLDALAEPERNAKAFVANVASQGVPLSSMQRWANTKGYTGESVAEANTIGERIKAGTVFDYQLPTKTDEFNRPIKRNRETVEPLYAEMERLGVKPPSKADTKTVNGKQVKLTPEEKRIANSEMQKVFELATSKLNTEFYKKKTDEQKRLYLQDTIKAEAKARRAQGIGKLGLGRTQ